MQPVDEKQCVRWINTNITPCSSISNLSVRALRERVKCVSVFEVPFSPTFQIIISSFLSKWFDYNTAMLCLTNWDGNDLGKHDVFLDIEKRFGFYEEIRHAPAFFFETKNDTNDRALNDIYVCLLGFNWEGYLFSNDNDTFIWMADEVIEIHMMSHIKAQQIQGLLNRLNIKTIN